MTTTFLCNASKGLTIDKDADPDDLPSSLIFIILFFRFIENKKSWKQRTNKYDARKIIPKYDFLNPRPLKMTYEFLLLSCNFPLISAYFEIFRSRPYFRYLDYDNALYFFSFSTHMYMCTKICTYRDTPFIIGSGFWQNTIDIHFRWVRRIGVVDRVI